MNIEKLKEAEIRFFEIYPGGFENPAMVEISKKHKPEKMTKFVEEKFAEENFDDAQTIVENMIKIISSSSVVSVFEKPKFRDFLKAMNLDEKKKLSQSLYELLYGDEEQGFNDMVEILQRGKIAKWPILTIIQTYLRPDYNIFIKPTTAKSVLSFFEIGGMKYTPKVNYYFYKQYRDMINEMKTKVSPKLAPNNMAFSGFLMISMGDKSVL